MKSKNETKSPLNSAPLRYPGQSLDEEIESFTTDAVMPIVIIPGVFLMLMISDWVYYHNQEVPNPIVITIIFILSVGWSIYKIFKARKKVKVLALGRDGERAVGMYLDTYREYGYKVLHDIPGKNFNLDHVLICEEGIFAIETKTYSKPIKGKAVITHNEKSLTYSNGYNDDKPLIQVKAAASWLKGLLKECTSRDFAVHPVLVFPGWYIESKCSTNNIWVLNPKALHQYIKKRPKVYSKEDVALVTSRLCHHIRNNVHI